MDDGYPGILLCHTADKALAGEEGEGGRSEGSPADNVIIFALWRFVANEITLPPPPPLFPFTAGKRDLTVYARTRTMSRSKLFAS